ncbi:hypothetical protein NPIL_479721 [Nephila pilipes]|uniref:Uncharacterized protein n=1 Tax=Nephila pilipes TaxID=299642 RepID=A0A8X6PK41_NEPPI|nr:hypothetical protein NPIL_479721 [Nephila pilipes]
MEGEQHPTAREVNHYKVIPSSSDVSGPRKLLPPENLGKSSLQLMKSQELHQILVLEINETATRSGVAGNVLI